MSRSASKYVAWRNGLIVLAEREANKALGTEPRVGLGDNRRAAESRWRRRWNAHFHREMARLAEDPFMQPDVLERARRAA